MKRTDLVAALSLYVVTPNGCWKYTGRIDPSGYGRAGKTAYAHRVFYEAHVGPIPDGLTVDHLCRNKGCVNPKHLEAVTLHVNILRSNNMAARNARKTHCKWGHEYTPENTVPRQRGWRECRACNRAKQRAAYARKHLTENP